MKRILFCIIMMTTVLGAHAQRRNGFRMGFGFRGGINVTDYSASHDGLGLSSRLGFHAAVQAPLMFGAVGVQPELMFVHNSLNVNGRRVKANTCEMPVLFTLRVIPILRLHAGPSFALADNSYYREEGEKILFGNAKPTCTYMIGASLRPLGHLLIDCRYNGSFNKTRNYFQGAEPRIKTYTLYLSVGYMF